MTMMKIVYVKFHFDFECYVSVVNIPVSYTEKIFILIYYEDNRFRSTTMT